MHTPSAEFRYPKTVIEAPEHLSSMALIECWRAHEATGGMRMHRDIPSRAIAQFLSNIVVCEPVGDWADGHIRLAGSVLTQRFGREIQGASISELYANDPEGARMLLANARRAQKARKPGLLSTRVCTGQVEVMRFEVVALPIWAPDGATLWSLVGVFRF